MESLCGHNEKSLRVGGCVMAAEARQILRTDLLWVPAIVIPLVKLVELQQLSCITIKCRCIRIVAVFMPVVIIGMAYIHGRTIGTILVVMVLVGVMEIMVGGIHIMELIGLVTMVTAFRFITQAIAMPMKIGRPGMRCTT